MPEEIALLIASYCSESAMRVSSGSGGNASAKHDTMTIEIVRRMDAFFADWTDIVWSVFVCRHRLHVVFFFTQREEVGVGYKEPERFNAPE